MVGLNKVMLIGNLGADPEIKTMQDGNRLANLRLATSKTWKDKDGNRQERTEWHRISVFSDGLVSVIEKYLSKGSRIYIEGELRTRSWEDQNEQKRYSTEIVLSGFNGSMIMLSSGSDASNQSSVGRDEAETRSSSINNDLDDEIPF